MNRLVFLSKGRGFGHAARDLRIIEAIRRQRPELEIEVASCGSGLAYYRARGLPCVDLDIPDAAEASPAAKWRVWRYLARTRRPDLVVSDEITWALTFCRHVLEVECVLLTDWFFADFGRPELDPLLDLAREVYFLDLEAAHERPRNIRTPVHFTGPVTAPFPDDRVAARTRLELSGDGQVAVVSLGGMPDRPEARRMLDRVRRAWRARPGGDADRLLVLADPLQPDDLSDPTVRWQGLTNVPELYYAAADVVVVDAMGFTACDLARNRIPVLALTDPAVSAVFPASFTRRVDFLRARGLIMTSGPEHSADELWRLLREAVATPADRYDAHAGLWGDQDAIAAQIIREPAAAAAVRPSPQTTRPADPAASVNAQER